MQCVKSITNHLTDGVKGYMGYMQGYMPFFRVLTGHLYPLYPLYPFYIVYSNNKKKHIYKGRYRKGVQTLQGVHIRSET